MNGIFRIFGAGYIIGLGIIVIIFGAMAGFASSMASGPCEQVAAAASRMPFNPCAIFTGLSGASIAIYAAGAAIILLGVFLAKKTAGKRLVCTGCKATVAKESKYCQNCGQKIGKNENPTQPSQQPAAKTA